MEAESGGPTPPNSPAAPQPAAPPRPKPRDPFGPPLDHNQVREVFRRLAVRPQAEQEAFVGKVNWNLLDEPTEYRLMSWLLDNVRSPEPTRQAFVLRVLDKLPHHKRARAAKRFAGVLGGLNADLAAQVADAFGPILGGAPKRSTKGPAKGAAKGPAKPPAAKQAAASAPPPRPPAPAKPEPPKEASVDDLAKLKDFFGKFGGAK